MITVFTSIYNRAGLLPRLYLSLLLQTDRDFEWLIIDDGSEDDCERVVEKFKLECSFSIYYYRQEHGGKHRAINRAVGLAKGELFFTVDSDDYLLPDSIANLQFYYKQIKDNSLIAGVVGCRCAADGVKIGAQLPFDVLDVDSMTFQYRLGYRGDMAEAVKTSILKSFPFPEFPCENFLTEDVVWNEMARQYKLRYFNRHIYVCEYLKDGLTYNLLKQHHDSPQGTMLYYKTLLSDDRLSCFQHVKAAINYWRYTVGYAGVREQLPLWAYLFHPVGWLICSISSLKRVVKTDFANG